MSVDSVTVSTKRIRGILALRRHEATPSICLELPVNPLVDSDHCRALSDEIRRRCSPWDRAKATRSLGDMLPDSAGIYMFVWTPDFFVCTESSKSQFRYVVYVGQAGGRDGSQNTLRRRYSGEYAQYVHGDPEHLWEKAEAKNRHERLRKFLTLSPLEFWWAEIDDNESLQLIERRLLNLFNPPGAIHGRAKIDKAKAQSAF